MTELTEAINELDFRAPAETWARVMSRIKSAIERDLIVTESRAMDFTD